MGKHIKRMRQECPQGNKDCEYYALGFHTHSRRGGKAFYEAYRQLLYNSEEPLTKVELCTELSKSKGTNRSLDSFTFPQLLARDPYIRPAGTTIIKDKQTHSQYETKLWTHSARLENLVQ